jgi:hypothetical protein
MEWRSYYRNNLTFFTKENSSPALIRLKIVVKWRKFFCLPQKNNSPLSLAVKYSIEKWQPRPSWNLWERSQNSSLNKSYQKMMMRWVIFRESKESILILSSPQVTIVKENFVLNGHRAEISSLKHIASYAWQDMRKLAEKIDLRSWLSWCVQLQINKCKKKTDLKIREVLYHAFQEKFNLEVAIRQMK